MAASPTPINFFSFVGRVGLAASVDGGRKTRRPIRARGDYLSKRAILQRREWSDFLLLYKRAGRAHHL